MILCVEQRGGMLLTSHCSFISDLGPYLLDAVRAVPNRHCRPAGFILAAGIHRTSWNDGPPLWSKSYKYRNVLDNR